MSNYRPYGLPTLNDMRAMGEECYRYTAPENQNWQSWADFTYFIVSEQRGREVIYKCEQFLE